MYEYQRSVFDHKVRHAQLRKYEEQFRASRRWTEAEDAELVMHFRDLVPENGKLMTHKQICELAWHHGRTATAIEKRLLDVLGYRVYYEHVHFHFH